MAGNARDALGGGAAAALQLESADVAAETSAPPDPRQARADPLGDLDATAPAIDLAAAINREHQAAIAAVRTALDHAARCGALLRQAKGELGHGRWLPWVAANLSFGDREARKYMRLADRIDQIGIQNSDLTLDAAMALLAEPNNHALRVMGSSTSVEWYSPRSIVERSVAVLGAIDCDPCWSPDSAVEAETTYAADGLARPWRGRLYLNPPCGREIERWVERLVDAYENGAVTAAIALLPARTDSAWFGRLDAYPRCFVRGRLTFSNAASAAPFPSAVCYLGPHLGRFVREFGPLGGIWARVGPEPAP